MTYLDKTSLAKTIDNVSEALLFGFEIPPALAIDELRFAASSIEKLLKRRISNENQYTLRRNFICESILKKVC
jgi:hypothetical protein